MLKHVHKYISTLIDKFEILLYLDAFVKSKSWKEDTAVIMTSPKLTGFYVTHCTV
jgi:hypothetical protein